MLSMDVWNGSCCKGLLMYLNLEYLPYSIKDNHGLKKSDETSAKTSKGLQQVVKGHHW
jgi:hypothetical protein